MSIQRGPTSPAKLRENMGSTKKVNVQAHGFALDVAKSALPTKDCDMALGIGTRHS